ncbi:unnamed protein product [Brassicogethes aeneus]|uniref:LEM domain-containing protein n=1 Tax=Brassicogethes aeneus TaxID=1431903 RepID=A0A9P0FEU5_BRAAE|nr:unnamed protein product [Brassicogethes aeneus]
MSIYRGRNRKEFSLASLLYDSIEDRDLHAVKLLLEENGADPNLVLPIKGISPFHLAIGCDSNDVAIRLTSLILQHGGNPNVRSDDGLTPLHISSAWGRYEILQLLLCSGGDPEFRDINNKTPIHYAYEENFTDCLNLLKAHLPNKQEIFNRENEETNKFNMVFDKIVVDNGTQLGEYEIVKEYDSQEYSITKKNLQLLPQADTTEYVMSWFSKHHSNTEQNSIYFNLTESNKPKNSIDSFESSDDESSVEVKKVLPVENITFRKVYTKTRKISTASKNSISPKPKELSVIELEDTKNDNTMYTADEFSTFEQFSKESGIISLRHSTKSQDSLFDEDLTVNSPKNSLKIPKISKQDASSDYMTCSTNSDNQILEKNIFEITEDLSVNLYVQDEVRSEGSNGSNLRKSQGVLSADLSFVSVSEVYKYVDEEKGVVLYERRFLKTPASDCGGSVKSSSFSSKMSSLPETIDYDTDTLRKELTLHGYQPGPITSTTKRVYLKKLRQLKKKPTVFVQEVPSNKKVYSVEIEKTLRDSTWQNDLSPYKILEESVSKQFSCPDPSRKWREGVNKTSFTYLLLDSRITNNLPCRAELMQPKEIWETFLSAIFYVGKGKKSRPYSHLYEAVSLWNKKEFKTTDKKLQNIIDIWKNNTGVICLQVFHNVIPVEAYTREASMILALKLENVKNLKYGDFYGIAATWSQKQKKMFGMHLLYKAMMIFLNEGERQLYPNDIDKI